MKYAELMLLTLDEVRAFHAANPGRVAAGNALRQKEYEAKQERKLARMGRKDAVVNGMTRNRYSASMNRVPTKRELR